ncbi:TolC family protein [Bremerella cremea]|uniref:TolC family protein n=2 Tax=Bremerella cremea TaxID=1031537 RepID=A0A368KSR2_9BACT|nr:TolC family protein [Bremerella cremea]
MGMAVTTSGRGSWWFVLGLSSVVGCATSSAKLDQPYQETILPADISETAAFDPSPAPIPNSQPPVQLASHQQSSEIQPPVLEPTTILPPAVHAFEQPTFSVAQAPAPVAVDNGMIGGLSLQQIQDLALANNPTIRQSSATAFAAQDYQYQVGRYANPNVGYTGSQLADQNTDQHLVFVEQEFVTAHKLQLNENVLGHAVQAQRWDVESQRFRVLTDVRMAFLDALVAQRRMEVIDNFQQVAAKGAELAEKRFKAMETAQSDQLQAEIQLNEVEVMRQQAQFKWDAAWQAMAAIAGVPEMSKSQLVGSLNPATGDLNWDDVYHNLLANSPELRSAYSRVSKTRANLSRQEVQAIPNLTAQLQAGHDNGTGSGMINVQVGAPIPVFNANRGNISAAYREYARATHSVKRVEMSLKARLAEVSRQYDSAMVAVKRYEEQILPKAKRTLDLAEQAYEAGEFSFIQVLIVRRTYFDTNLQYIESLGELAKAHAQIDGLLLTGGLDEPGDFQDGDTLRGQTFSQQ